MVSRTEEEEEGGGGMVAGEVEEEEVGEEEEEVVAVCKMESIENPDAAQRLCWKEKYKAKIF